jgi:hypothetical protein
MNTKPDTIMLALFVVLGVVLVTGLVVMPAALEEAEAKCDGSKNNGDACKPKKSKDND